MTFQEVLAQVIDWLQRERRVSYRALRRQFDLDDDYLEDLKDASSMPTPWSTTGEGLRGAASTVQAANKAGKVNGFDKLRTYCMVLGGFRVTSMMRFVAVW